MGGLAVLAILVALGFGRPTDDVARVARHQRSIAPYHSHR
jgi:hypothetical protein